MYGDLGISLLLHLFSILLVLDFSAWGLLPSQPLFFFLLSEQSRLLINLAVSSLSMYFSELVISKTVYIRIEWVTET